MRTTYLLAGLIAVSMRSAAAAAPAITVENAWSRATTPGAQTAAVYMTIVDHGAPDVLTAVATPIAGMAQMHHTVTQNRMSTMVPVASMPVSGAKPAVFSPGGYHVMLTELKQKLVKGQTFPITLTFQHAGPVQATVTVQALTAGGSPADMAPMSDMDMSMPMPSQHSH